MSRRQQRKSRNARKKSPRKKPTKRQARGRTRKKPSKKLLQLRARRLRYEHSEARRLGVTHREFIRRRAARERAHRAKLDELRRTGGMGAVFRYLIQNGQLDTRDPTILDLAGISEAEAQAITDREIERGLGPAWLQLSR